MNRARKPNESFDNYRKALKVREPSRDKVLYQSTKIVTIPSRSVPGIIENVLVSTGPARRLGDGQYVKG